MTEKLTSIEEVYAAAVTENPENKIFEEVDSSSLPDKLPEVEAAPAPESAEAAPEAPKTEEATSEPATAETAPAAPADIEPIVPPPGLTEEERKVFGQAPPALQAAIARAMKGQQRSYTQKMMSLSEQAKQIGQIGEILKTAKPHEAELTRQGVNPAQAYASMLEWATYLQRDPNSALRELADLYGADLTVPAGTNGAQPTQRQQQPRTTLYDPRVDQLLDAQRQQMAWQQQRLVAEMEGVSKAWREEKDSAGMQAHPYIEDVEETMAEFIPVVQRRDPTATPKQILDRAYRLAIQEHPEVQEAIAKREAARAKATAINQTVNSASKAARANGVKGTGGSVKPVINMSDTGAVMRAIMDGTLESI